MPKKEKIIIAILSVVTAGFIFVHVASFIETLTDNSNVNNMKTLSLDNYQVGFMIESGDFMLWNRKTNVVDYCIKDSLSKTIYFQIMKVDQMNYNQYFEKPKEKKK